ncbi:MAG TPA: ABC transporter ATP-binding protein [Gammaproteobacteria bacterium]
MREAVVSAEKLSKSFGHKEVLHDITAVAEAGDVIGVLGKNGAGKTTLLEVLLGFGPPTSGSAKVFGEESMHLSERAKARIGFVPQQDELIEMLTGEQQLKVTSAFYRSWDHALTGRLISEWEIPMDRAILKLSPGERQKLALVLALGHRPDLLVLDEPVASLDPIARRAFLKQLVDITGGEQRTVLFSSHIVSDLERAANKIWIVKHGRLIWQGELDALKESVVRLHVRGRRELESGLGIPNALSERIRGTRATVAVAAWNPAEQARLAARLDADIEAEPLGLEEIFVELHA